MRYYWFILTLSAFFFAMVGWTQSPTIDLVATFLNPPPASSDRFGADVELAGDKILIGAHEKDLTALGVGIVYVYDRVTFEPLGTIQKEFPTIGDQFGFQIKWDGGDLVAISARLDNTASVNGGAVYVYDINTLTLQRTITSPEPAEAATFGWSMDIQDGNILIGAQYDAAQQAGAAYLFDLQTGELIQTFRNPNLPEPGRRDGFGAVSFTGRDVLVGAGERTIGGFNQVGAAYHFDRESGALLKTLSNPAPRQYDLFGFTVAVSTDMALVGAHMSHITSSTGEGAVYVYRVPDGLLTSTLLSPRPSEGGGFGYRIEIQGDFLFVGEQFGFSSGIGGGAVHVYNFPSLDFVATIENPLPGNKDTFGRTISVRDRDILIGAPFDDTAGHQAGAAFLFRVRNHPPSQPNVDVTPDDPDTLDDLLCTAGGSIDPEGETVSLSYAWFADGVQITTDGFQPISGPTLGHTLTRRDQVIQCRVTPFDGEVSGTPGSDSVTIRNTLPPVPIIEILPEVPTPEDGLAVRVDNLIVTDVDGDIVRPLFEWYESGPDGGWVLRGELSGFFAPPFFSAGSAQVSNLFTQAGEDWRVDVTFLDFINETDFKATSTKPPQYDLLKELGPTSTDSVTVIPDLEGSNFVDVHDALFLYPLWNRTKGDLDAGTRELFFEETEPDTATIGFSDLFHLARFWYQGVGE